MKVTCDGYKWGRNQELFILYREQKCVMALFWRSKNSVTIGPQSMPDYIMNV